MSSVNETSEQMRGYRSKDPRVRDLVKELTHLVGTVDSQGEGGRSRAALAELRHSINDPLRGAKYVVPHLGMNEGRGEIWFYRIASLFATHRRHQAGVSLGTAMYRCRDKRGSDSIEDRFLSLLRASPDNLFASLQRVIKILAADDIALDWELLLDNVLNWDDPEKKQQQMIARYFYRNVDRSADADALPPLQAE